MVPGSARVDSDEGPTLAAAAAAGRLRGGAARAGTGGRVAVVGGGGVCGEVVDCVRGPRGDLCEEVSSQLCETEDR